MDISLSLIPYEDKSILGNLLQLYRYDSSEFDDNVLSHHGLYLYKYLDHQWTEEYRRPFMIKVNGEIAGFALVILNVPNEFTKISSAEKTNVISDYFIMRKFRHRGIGKHVAFSIFKEFKGVWEVKQTITNKSAHEFWEKIISEYTDTYKKEILQNESWNGPVIVFQS